MDARRARWLLLGVLLVSSCALVYERVAAAIASYVIGAGKALEELDILRQVAAHS